MQAWRTLIDRWLAANTVAGVHVRWVSAQQCVYTLCVLRQRKQVISVVDKRADITSLDELLNYLTSDVPVYLTVEGKGVLVRKVADERDDFLREIIPDAQAADFYTTRHPHQFVSVVRRSVVDQTLAALTQRGQPVLAVCTGPFALNALVPFLSDEVTSLSVAGQQLTMVDQQISSVISIADHDEPDARYAIGDEVLPARYLLAYATALRHFVPTEAVIAQEGAQQEFRQRQLFTKALPLLLGFFLLALLINTAVYLPTFRKHEALTEQASAHRVVLNRLASLQKEVAEKETFLRTLGWQHTNQKAALADRLATTVPAEITLTEVQVSPRDEAQHKKDKKQVFDNQTLWVAGQCSDVVVLNSWLSELEEQVWIHRLSDQQYAATSNDSFGSFSFTLWLHP